MASLKRHEAIMLENLNSFALTLYTLGHTTESAILEALKPQIKAFEEESGMRTLIKDLPDGGFYFQEVDPRNDFLRSRIAAGGAQQTLKAKLSGIQIDIKVRKDDFFEFKNKEIAKALEEFAEIVRHMPVEASIVGEDDFPNGLGAYPAKLNPDASNSEGLEGVLDDGLDALADDDLVSEPIEGCSDGAGLAPSNSIALDNQPESLEQLQNDGDVIEIAADDVTHVDMGLAEDAKEAKAPSNPMSLHPGANQ